MRTAESSSWPRAKRRRFFLTSLNRLLLRSIASLVLLALLAGLAGELWIRPSPLLDGRIVIRESVVRPHLFQDFDRDGWLDWLIQSNNAEYGASLVLRHLPGEAAVEAADRQYYFKGEHVTGQLQVLPGGGERDRLLLTSTDGKSVWLSSLELDRGRAGARWDTLLFDGSRAPLTALEQPRLVREAVAFPRDPRFLLPVWGNFRAWRGALVVDPLDSVRVALLPAGTGLQFVDSLSIRLPDGRERLFAYACGADNDNALGGVADEGAWLFLVDADSGLVLKRQLPAYKTLRAAVFPDRRHALLVGGKLREGWAGEAPLLVWDAWSDSLVARLDVGVPQQKPVRDGDGVLWYDRDGRVRRARPERPLGDVLYRMPVQFDFRTQPVGDGWLSSVGRDLELRRRSDGRLLLRQSGLGDNPRDGRLEFAPGAALPRRLHCIAGKRIDSVDLLLIDLQPVSFLLRWLRHPFLAWSLLPGALLVLLGLGLRMFRQEQLLRRLVPQDGTAVGLLDGCGRLVYANDLLEEWLRASGNRLPPAGAAAGAQTPLGERRLRWRERAVPTGFGAPWWQLQADDVTHQVENEQQKLFLAKLAVMAHDLKAPLTPLRLQAESIEDALPLLPPETAARVGRSLAEIDRQVERSLQLITRFMGMARSEFELGPVSLPDIARAALRELGLQAWPALAARLEHDAAASWVARAEGEVLQLALFELLQNAAQALEGRGTVVVSLARTASGGAALVVADDGPGVPEADLARVLEPGYTTRRKGTGFGLYFVQRVLERMGASLALRNRPGGGLEARIEFAPLGES